jgi:ADP-heptose:LPS heptosyltransferase
MKILTFSKKVTVYTTHGEVKSESNCNPGERLIFDNDNALSIQTNPGSASYILEVTDLNPLLAELAAHKPAHWKRKRVLFYRNRGYGDQLMMSAVPRFFREILGADSHVLSDKVHEPVWAYNPYIGGVPLSVPMHLDTVWRANGARPFFDGAFFIESASEWDNDQEQPNVYDRLFGLMGLDPSRIPAKFKRPVFSLHNEDIDKRLAWLKQVGSATQTDLTQGYIFVQLRATNKVRSIPLKTGAMVLQALNDIAEKKSLTVLVADNEPLSGELAQVVAKLPRVKNVATAINNIRLLGSVIGGSMLVVGPDSMALHFAAAFELPALGIWGPFSPESRTKYYPNQVHLWHKELCNSSPCFNYLPELPVSKCPRGIAQRTCEVYEGVTYQEVYDAVLSLLP